MICELHVGDFSPRGTFAGVTERLGYLADLGVNAVQLMPPYETDSGDYWGYEPTYHLAVRRDFGTMRELMVLIDEAHGRGIAVLLDMVLAHTGRGHPFHLMYPYHESPWYGRGIGQANQFGLPELDYAKGATNSFVRDVQAYWLGVFHVDGFRYDYLAGIGRGEDGRGLPYLMRTAREVRPEAYLIGECIPEDPTLVNGSDISGVWHTRCRLALTALLAGRDAEPYSSDDFAGAATAFDPAGQEYDRPDRMVNYVESHDDERLMQMLAEAGDDAETAAAKCRLAITALMTMCGEPMLSAGQEFGQAGPAGRQVRKLQWSLLDGPAGRRLHAHARAMCRLRRERTSLRRQHAEFPLIDAEARCLAMLRSHGATDSVLVVMNFSPRPVELDVPISRQGLWHEHGLQEVLDLRGSLRVSLAPWDARIFLSGVS